MENENTSTFKMAFDHNQFTLKQMQLFYIMFVY